MHSPPPLDCAGRRRSPATLSGFHQGRPPRNKGLRYPPDPPTVEEIIAVMRAAGDDAEGLTLRGVIIVLWRAGLRISEALALTESDLVTAGVWWCGAERVASVARWAWTAGRGTSLSRGLRSGRRCLWGLCSACSADRPADRRARRRRFGCTCATSLSKPASGAGSRLISSGTRMQSRCHTKACRWS